MAHRSPGARKPGSSYTIRLRVGALISAGIVLAVIPPVARAAGPRPVGGGKGGPSLVSVAVDGSEADGASFTPAISGNGRFVAFASSASKLVKGDRNKAEDVFVYDRATGRTERVSVSSTGAEANKDSFDPAISWDGRFVAFTSAASNLVEGDHNNELDIFVRDRLEGRTVLVSVGPQGALGDGPSMAASISGDGRLVAFESDAETLVSNDDNGTSDVFIRDLVAGVTRKVSVAGNGQQTESPSFGAAVSTDGSSVAFESFSSRLVPGDTNNALDVFVADVESGSIERVSVATGGEQANERSYSPSISDDGRAVAFASFASNLVDNDTNGLLDVFLHRRDRQTTVRLSVGYDGREGDGLSFAPVVSDDGQFVVFSSEAGNLVPDDTNGTRDVFLATESGIITRLSRRPAAESDAQEGNGPSLGPVVDGSGVIVAFASFASNLVNKDTNGQPDVFVTESAEFKAARAAHAPTAPR